MKSRCCLLLSCAFALALATPALAAWTPLLPGWTVHEFPLAVDHIALTGPWSGVTLDPVSGDCFFLGSLSPDNSDFAIFRVSRTGQVQTIANLASPTGRPVFDPVHRVLFAPSAWNEIQRLGENGEALPPLTVGAPGPLAVGPDGELYSMTLSSFSPSGLRLVRYDSGTAAWVPSLDLPAFSPASPGTGVLPNQIVFDASGKLFFCYGAGNWRVDAAATTFVGGWLLMGPLAVGPGFLFNSLVFYDPTSNGGASPTMFATSPDHRVQMGVAVPPDGSVLFFDQANNDGGGCSLVVFTMGPTPGIRRSWGSVKGLGR